MTTVIIPVYNISSRGTQRLFNELFTLNYQLYTCKVIIVDGSNQNEYASNRKMTYRFPHFTHIHFPIQEFNKCILLNKGIREATTEWVMCTDCDYLFYKDFTKMCAKHRSGDRMLFKEVRMLPKININTTNMTRWEFPEGEDNPWGRKANGACQYATRQWFLENPYDERMIGWGAMDNMTHWKALATKLEVYWIQESSILHQYHKQLKFKTKDSQDQFAKNIKLVHYFRKEHGL